MSRCRGEWSPGLRERWNVDRAMRKDGHRVHWAQKRQYWFCSNCEVVWTYHWKNSGELREWTYDDWYDHFRKMRMVS